MRNLIIVLVVLGMLSGACRRTSLEEHARREGSLGTADVSGSPEEKVNQRGHLSGDLLQKWAEARQHYEKGLAFKRAGKYPAAVSELQQALALKGDYVEAHWALAQTYKALGYPEGAILEYHAVAWFAEEAELGCKA